MKTILWMLSTVCLMTTVAPAFAHPGPRVWIGSTGSTITTFTSNNDLSPVTYTPERVFVGGIDQDTLAANGHLDEFPVPGTGVFATDFPGYQVRTDGNGGIGTGSTFGFRLAGPLLVFDPVNHLFKTTQEMYGSPGPAPQMSESSGTHVTLTGPGPVDGFSFFSYNTSGDHAHVYTTLYGDGSHPVDGPHSVYAVPMQLTGAGLSDSLPYYVLFGRDIGYLSGDVGRQTFVEAVDVARLTLVPEPGSLAMLGLGAIFIRRVRRR